MQLFAQNIHTSVSCFSNLNKSKSMGKWPLNLLTSSFFFFFFGNWTVRSCFAVFSFFFFFMQLV